MPADTAEVPEVSLPSDTPPVPAAQIDPSVCTAHDGRPCAMPTGFYILADDGTTITGASCLIGKQYHLPKNITNSRCGGCGNVLPSDVYTGPTCPVCTDVLARGGTITPKVGLTGRPRFIHDDGGATGVPPTKSATPASATHTIVDRSATVDDWQETLEDVVRLRGLTTGAARALATKVLVAVASRA